MRKKSPCEIGNAIAAAFRLTARPLAIYGSDKLPKGGEPIASVNRCLAAAMYYLAASSEHRTLYVGVDAKAGCCPGGLTHLGLMEYPSSIKYFVSTGKSDFRGGVAEYLKASPEIVEQCFRAMGKITPLNTTIVIQACDDLPDPDPGVRAICLFGNAEQVRNLGALVHFDRDEPFFPVLVPWGPVCSTLITFPAGMAAKAPLNTAFMGPQDPTLNYALPEDTMALGVPIRVAERMAENIPFSFISKRSDVAFPEKRFV
jgi:hypothetical protein